MTDRQLNVFWAVLAILLLIWNATDAYALDIETAIWQCFEEGYYTHSQSIELLAHPEIHDILPFEDAPLDLLCVELIEELL